MMRKKQVGAVHLSVVQYCAAVLLCLGMAIRPVPAHCPQPFGIAGAADCGFGLLETWADTGSGSRVYDGAWLFSSGEVEELEEAVTQTRDETGFDAAVVTTDDAQGKSTKLYAADRYEELGIGKGFSDSGILYLIDMDNREIFLLTKGDATRLLTDERIDAILDAAYEKISDGDYAGSAVKALEEVVSYAEEGIVSGQYNYDEETGRISVHRRISGFEFLLALGISLIVAGGAVMTVRRQYNMEESPQKLANYNMAYRASSQLEVGARRDHLLNTFVTTMLIASAAANRGSGGNGSGMSSSGRSTTFNSSSGKSYGGGGRKF